MFQISCISLYHGYLNFSAITAGACYTIYYFLVKVSIADFVIKQAKVEVKLSILFM